MANNMKKSLSTILLVTALSPLASLHAAEMVVFQVFLNKKMSFILNMVLGTVNPKSKIVNI